MTLRGDSQPNAHYDQFGEIPSSKNQNDGDAKELLFLVPFQ